MDIKKLGNRWIRLFDRGKQNSFVKEVFNHLVDRYSEKYRYYHTLEHINACLEQFDQHADFILGLVNPNPHLKKWHRAPALGSYGLTKLGYQSPLPFEREFYRKAS